MKSYLGDNAVNKMKINIDKYWQSGNATNESGFSAIPSSVYSRAKGFNTFFLENEEVAAFAIEKNNNGTENGFAIVDSEDDFWVPNGFGNGYFLAVRCVKD